MAVMMKMKDVFADDTWVMMWYKIYISTSHEFVYWCSMMMRYRQNTTYTIKWKQLEWLRGAWSEVEDRDGRKFNRFEPKLYIAQHKETIDGYGQIERKCWYCILYPLFVFLANFSNLWIHESKRKVVNKFSLIFIHSFGFVVFSWCVFCIVYEKWSWCYRYWSVERCVAWLCGNETVFLK